jgi:multiple sugar transport system substrate-binding protein
MRLHWKALSPWILAATAGLVVGLTCGVEAKEPAEPEIRLRVWQGFKNEEVTLLRKAMAEFSTDWSTTHGRKLTLVEEQVPFDTMSTRMRMAAPGGRRLLPDMAMVDANKMAELVYGGIVRELEDLPTMVPGGSEALRREYSPGAFETNIVRWRGKDRLFGLPAQTTTLALFWNKTMFAAKGAELRAAGLDPDRAPVDWDEVVKYSRIIGDPANRRYGFAFNNSLWFTMPFINQYRGTFAATDSQGKWVPTTDDPRLVAAIRRKMDMFLVDKIAAPSWKDSETNPDQGFIDQSYAMILTGPWNVQPFRSNKINFGVAMIPRVPMDEALKLGLVPPEAGLDSPEVLALSSSSIGGQNIVLLNTCPEPAIALEFMRYFTGEKVQREWAQELGQIPTHRGAQKGLDLRDNPEVAVFMNQVNLARPWPRLPRSGQIETDIMNPNLNLVLQGRQSVEDALKRVGVDLKRWVLDPVNMASDLLEKESKKD